MIMKTANKLFYYSKLSLFVFILLGISPANAGEVLATYEFTPGWATFGLPLPEGAARDGVLVGELPTQTDVKNRHPDGSIKFAVVTANVAEQGSYNITPMNSSSPIAGVGDKSPSKPKLSSLKSTKLLDNKITKVKEEKNTTKMLTNKLSDAVKKLFSKKDRGNGSSSGGSPNIPIASVGNIPFGTVILGMGYGENPFENYNEVLYASTYDTYAEFESNWLDGPLVTERRIVTKLKNLQTFVDDPNLVAIFDIRYYLEDGSYTIDITVENSINQESIAPYEYAIYTGHCPGVMFPDFPDDEWSQCVNTYLQLDKVTQYAYTRWRHTIDYVNKSEVRHDLAALKRSKAISNYLENVVADIPEYKGDEWGILKIGTLNSQMYACGGRDEIAPRHSSQVRYLVHQRASNRELALELGGNAAARWPIHMRDTDLSIFSIDRHPSIWLDESGLNRCNPAVQECPHGYGARGDGVYGVEPDIAHQPSFSYVPYIVTGDRFFVDEVAFWAAYNLFSTWEDGVGYRPRGLDKGLLHINEVRGFGWALRNIADAASFLPDDDPMKAYFTNKVMNNLEWLDEYAAGVFSRPGNIHKVPWGYKRNRTFDEYPNVWIGQWEHNYLAQAIDIAHDHGFQGGDVYRDAVAEFVVSIFNSGVYSCTALYETHIGITPSDPHWAVNYTQNHDEIARNSGAFGELYTGYENCFQGYYIDHFNVADIARRSGVPGSQEAFDFYYDIYMRQPFIDGIPDGSLRAGWAYVGH